VLHEFFLGTPQVAWLWRYKVPLFVSHERLKWRSWARRFPGRALEGWALDSGGFSILAKHGRWHQPWQLSEFCQSITRYQWELGNLRWVAVQDWMCEPEIIKKTGLSVRAHQELTVENYEWVRSLFGHVPWVPVLQGWEEGDHLRHYEMYLARGFDLRDAPVVGVGTMCRRQGTATATNILSDLHRRTGLRLHGFGLKLRGLRDCAEHLFSADSMAWSLNARKRPALPGHTHRSCANCPEWAMAWRERVLASLAAQQPEIGQLRFPLTR
jgi:hypothetical protein